MFQRPVQVCEIITKIVYIIQKIKYLVVSVRQNLQLQCSGTNDSSSGVLKDCVMMIIKEHNICNSNKLWFVNLLTF